MNMKILKNLLVYPGSSRRAFGAPQNDGSLGKVLFLGMQKNEQLLENAGY